MANNRASTSVLLTGATGFLGSHLAHGLINSGYNVVAFRRRSSNLWRVADIEEQIDWYDATNLEAPFKQYGKINHVIHTATVYGRHNEKNSLLVETNILFPLKLFEIATLFNTDTFFNTDTILYKYLNSYSLSKKQLCEWLRMLSGTTKVVNIKLQHIYGPKDDDSKFVTSIINQCLANIPEIKLTKGEQRRDFVYIADVVDAYIFLLKYQAKFIEQYVDIEIGSGHSVPIKELVKIIGDLTGSRTRFLFGAIPYRENELMDSRADIKQLSQLGWRPRTSLTNGLKATIEAERKVRK